MCLLVQLIYILFSQVQWKFSVKPTSKILYFVRESDKNTLVWIPDISIGMNNFNFSLAVVDFVKTVKLVSNSCKYENL